VTHRARLTDLFYGSLDELAERIGGPLYLTDPGLSHRCPKAGLYFFFEHGEARPNGRPRVVRIGTHALTPTSRTTLWGRLGQHRGQSGGTNPGGGNHRGSIFRRHVGSALLNQRGDNSQLLASWMAPGPHPDQVQAERALEVEVSRMIREMPFLWLDVPTRPDGGSDRGLLERNTIALLSTLAGGSEAASPTWLGRHAIAPKVSGSSLWNVNHVDDAFEPSVLDLLQSYVRTTA
jgi:hypothetical protein